LPVVIVVAGPEKIDNAEAHKFEMHRQGAVQMTEFLQVKDDGIFGVARMAGDGAKDDLNSASKNLESSPQGRGEMGVSQPRRRHSN